MCCSSDASGALGPCPCGRPLDPSGHQCAACPHTGVLGRRGSLWRAPQHTSAREAGGESDYERPSPGSGPASKSRSRQSPFGSGGRWTPPVPWRSACDRHHDGVPGPHGRFCAPAMRNNKRGSHGPSPRSERAHLPELAQAHGRARLVVVACEVGGRWSDEALSFLNSLANAKVRDEPEDFKKVVKASWLRRWKALLACAAARAFALSLLERRCAPGCDGPTPSSDEVVGAHRYEA